MKLSPEQVRHVAEHYLKQGDAANAIAALRIASDSGDALSTLFLATFVRDDKVLDADVVANEAPDAFACWLAAYDREQHEGLHPQTVRARDLKRMLSAFAAMTTTPKVKEPA